MKTLPAAETTETEDEQLSKLYININEQSMTTDRILIKHQRFLKMAKVTSLRSKDPNTQVGCVIVDKDDCIVSIGYNGFPIGVDDDVFRWDKEDPEDNKHLYVVHAEMNAIINKVHKRRSIYSYEHFIHTVPFSALCDASRLHRVRDTVSM